MAISLARTHIRNKFLFKNVDVSCGLHTFGGIDLNWKGVEVVD